jgi:hypothetical protein
MQIKMMMIIVGTRNRGLPACSIAPQPSTLPLAPFEEDTFSNILQQTLSYPDIRQLYSNYVSNGTSGCFKLSELT